MDQLNYSRLKVREQGTICFIQLYRPDANNTIDETMICELKEILAFASHSNTTIIVLEGLPEVFCFGADFDAISKSVANGVEIASDPEPLYDLWYQMAFGNFITISHVRGKANAGGLGFIAASDIVLADESALFSLSELLFGLIPAIVLPFLIRRIGFQRAHYLTSSTQTIAVQQAYNWGLVDAYDKQSQSLLQKHLLRLRRISKKSIIRYKAYIHDMNPLPLHTKQIALNTNREVFSDLDNLSAITRYAEKGLFPWEDLASEK